MELPFVGKNFEELKKILSGHFFIPYFLYLECKNLLKNLLAFNPSQRLTLEDIMKACWVNSGQAEELRPYSKPPWDDLDSPGSPNNKEHGI